MYSDESSNFACNTPLQALQFQLETWCAVWRNNPELNDRIEKRHIDMTDLVRILQTLGFSIRRMGGSRPNETAPLNGGEKGVRIIIMCNHSGNRFILEKPLHKDNCDCCTVLTDDSTNSLWELDVSSLDTDPSLVEVMKLIIPPLPTEKNCIIYSVIWYLIRMIHEYGKVDSISVSTGEPPSPREELPSSIEQPFQRVPGTRTVHDFVKYPLIVLSSPSKDNESPTRYRSLDTLTTPGASVIPEPGEFSAMPINALSEYSIDAFSNNTTRRTISTLFSSQCSIDESQGSGKALPLLKSAIIDLVNAVSLMERDKSDTFFDYLEKHIKQIRSRSKSTTSSQTQSSLSRSISSPSLSRQKGAVSKQVPKSTSKLQFTKKKEPVPGPSKKRSTLYANVASTIPKVTRSKTKKEEEQKSKK